MLRELGKLLTDNHVSRVHFIIFFLSFGHGEPNMSEKLIGAKKKNKRAFILC